MKIADFRRNTCVSIKDICNHLTVKLQYKPAKKELRHSIHIARIHQPYVGEDWHFHEEFELIYFLEGHGLRMVGDHMSYFQKNELVLVGSCLPHLWRNKVDESHKNVDFIVLKFPAKFQGIDLFAMPELSNLRHLLRRSANGISFSVNVASKVQPLLLKLVREKHGTTQFVTFLQILNILAAYEGKLLSSLQFPNQIGATGEGRIQKVIDFISQNYQRKISLGEVSGLIYMTPPAFCRFFKNRTNRTFSHFLNEYRITQACQLLINGEIHVKQICYEVGFKSLTNFNRAFKRFKYTSPTAYRAQHNPDNGDSHAKQNARQS